MVDSSATMLSVKDLISIIADRGTDEFMRAISAVILDSSDCKLASTDSTACFSVWRRSRSFCGDWSRSLPELVLVGLDVGRSGERGEPARGGAPRDDLSIGIWDVDKPRACAFFPDPALGGEDFLVVSRADSERFSFCGLGRDPLVAGLKGILVGDIKGLLGILVDTAPGFMNIRLDGEGIRLPGDGIRLDGEASPGPELNF